MGAVDSQRDAISYYVQGVLDNAAKTETSSLHVAEVMDAVRSVFDEACADYAQVWNHLHSRASVAGHLAPEMLTNCFLFADFRSLVQATHVCRRWRALALADRRLWASFRIGKDRDGTRDMRQAVEQLSAMLDRSQPVPFVLQLPWSASWEKERFFSVLQGDVWRLQSYTGPRDIYTHLNPHGEPMPFITEITFLQEYSAKNPFFDIPSDWGTRGVPNLRRLVAPTISIPAICDPLPLLAYIRLNAAGPSAGYRRLFQCCPNLVTLELMGIDDNTILPVAPLPTSLYNVALHAIDMVGVEFASLLSPWTGQYIPRLTIYGARSLSAAVDFFTSSYQGPVTISMTRNQITMSLSSNASAPPAESQPQHVVYPFTWREFNQLLALRGTCAARLTSLTLHGDRFWDLFNAALTAPHLAHLEFHFKGSTNARDIPELTFLGLYLAAQSLRDMVVCVPFDGRTMRQDKWCSDAVTAMCLSLRLLINYNTALLETIKVRGARRHCLPRLWGPFGIREDFCIRVLRDLYTYEYRWANARGGYRERELSVREIGWKYSLNPSI